MVSGSRSTIVGHVHAVFCRSVLCVVVSMSVDVQVYVSISVIANTCQNTVQNIDVIALNRSQHMV